MILSLKYVPLPHGKLFSSQNVKFGDGDREGKSEGTIDAGDEENIGDDDDDDREGESVTVVMEALS